MQVLRIRPSRGTLQVVSAGTVSTNDFKTGLTIELDSTPYKVVGELLACCVMQQPHDEGVHQLHVPGNRAGCSHAMHATTHAA
jgi:hypothetical protein